MRWVGKWLGGKLKLEEGSMEGTKKWWQSKNVWTGIVTGLLGIYMSLQPVLSVPAIPEWVFALLGGLGVYTRVTADKKIN